MTEDVVHSVHRHHEIKDLKVCSHILPAPVYRHGYVTPHRSNISRYLSGHCGIFLSLLVQMSSLSEAQGVSPCFKDAADFFFFKGYLVAMLLTNIDRTFFTLITAALMWGLPL